MIKQLTHNELNAWQQANKDFLLIDVREVSEREHFHIGGEFIPLSEVVKKAPSFPKDKPLSLIHI